MPTNTDLIRDLSVRVAGLEALPDERAVGSADKFRELTARVQALTDQVFRLAQRVKAAEQRCDALQRLSDRGWGLMQAVVLSVLSLLAGAVVTLVVRK